MATNRLKPTGRFLSLAVTNPASPTSGAPVRIGNITGVALTDKGASGNAAGDTTVDLGPAVYNLSVDDDAGTGVAVGDKLYYHDTATGSPATNINNVSASGYFFGYALAPLTANQTKTIAVLKTMSAS